MACKLDEQSAKSESSDSDDDLSSGFPTLFSKRAPDKAASDGTRDMPQAKANKLDDLLSEHVKEAAERTRLGKVKEKLLQDLEKDSQDESQHSQSLASEHEGHIEQLDVNSTEPTVQPGITLFDPDKFCCLYSERTSPFYCGFTPNNSAIDVVVASILPETLTDFLLSKVLVTCVNQLSDVDSVLLWLFNILAIHRSPVTVYSCYSNLAGILNQMQVQSISGSGSNNKNYWRLHPLSIMRIFVNLGADSEEILGEHHPYTQSEVSKYLAVENDENSACLLRPEGQLCGNSIQLVFKVLATALQHQSHLRKEELNNVMFMLAKVQLDHNVNRYISLEAQECFSAVLQSYSEADWPSVVPSLVRQLCVASDHHHNKVHLANILPETPRGSYLQVRLSYFCLWTLLFPGTRGPTDQQIIDFKLSDVAHFCQSMENPEISLLAKSLSSQIKHDKYRSSSAIKLVDLCVGDDLYRSSQPWQTLEYLIGQIKMVIKTIKDNIGALEMSKIKDSLSELKVKWSLSLQDHKSKQRSILPWVSMNRQEVVRQEVLSDSFSIMDDDSD